MQGKGERNEEKWRGRKRKERWSREGKGKGIAR